MKIVHTFIPSNHDITEEMLDMMLLSVLLVKQYYNNVVLYTNDEICEIVKNYKIPYTEINTEVLNGVNVKTFSIPKLMVYSVQNEPYIHIDLDTFIFDKIDFHNRYTTYSTFMEGMDVISNFNAPTFYNALKGFYKTYIKNSYFISDKLDNEFVRNISYNQIPNMSVFGGHKHELIKESSRYCLKIYNDNIDFFDSDYYNACVIEQLFIPSAMRMISGENQHITFLFKGNPNIFNFSNEFLEYPYNVNSNGDIMYFNDKVDLMSKIDYNFNGFLHLNGYKSTNGISELIKEKINKIK